MSGQVYANAQLGTKSPSSISAKISSAVLRLQQNLSNQYGIPAFGLSGQLDTIPTDLKFSNIFEGFGQYGNAASFKQAVVDKVSQNPSAFNVTITQNPNGGSPTVTIPDPTQPQRTFNVDDSKKPLIETTGQNGFTDFISKNKNLVVIGLVGLFAVVMMGGRR